MGVSGFMLAATGWASCGYIETAYFQNKVDVATQEMVVQRYGPPHEAEQLKNGETVWTYYDRGSATASYSGYARSTFCQAYILKFDKDGILRAWAQRDCHN
jgi:hypothetical protein